MAAKRKRTRGPLAPDKYLSVDQLKQLKSYVKAQADLARNRHGYRAVMTATIVDVLLNSGLRAGELIQLRMGDMPHCHGKLIINVSEGKGCIQRSVQISSALAKRIETFVKRYRKATKPKSFLFINERRGPLSYYSLYSRIRIIGRAAGIGRLSPHMFRHTYSMRWYAQTKDLFGLQDNLGHKDTRTTHIYARSSNELMRRQVEDFDL